MGRVPRVVSMKASLRTTRFFALTSASLALVVFAACSASNGDSIPSAVYDASPLDAGGNPLPPGQDSGTDAPTPSDASSDGEGGDGGDSGPPSEVRIQEIFVDNALLGDVSEYVELSGAPGTSVDDLRLRLVDRNGNVKYDVPAANPGEKIGGGGLWVVGGGQVFKVGVSPYRVDHEVNVNSWGFDNTAGAVQLVRGNALVDVVGYSSDADAGTIPNASSPPVSTVEGKPALVPNIAKRAFGRKPLAADTNDNRTDFCKMLASPGYPQNACEP